MSDAGFGRRLLSPVSIFHQMPEEWLAVVARPAMLRLRVQDRLDI